MIKVNLNKNNNKNAQFATKNAYFILFTRNIFYEIYTINRYTYWLLALTNLSIESSQFYSFHSFIVYFTPELTLKF